MSNDVEVLRNSDAGALYGEVSVRMKFCHEGKPFDPLAVVVNAVWNRGYITQAFRSFVKNEETPQIQLPVLSSEIEQMISMQCNLTYIYSVISNIVDVETPTTKPVVRNSAESAFAALVLDIPADVQLYADKIRSFYVGQAMYKLLAGGKLTRFQTVLQRILTDDGSGKFAHDDIKPLTRIIEFYKEDAHFRDLLEDCGTKPEEWRQWSAVTCDKTLTFHSKSTRNTKNTSVIRYYFTDEDNEVYLYPVREQPGGQQSLCLIEGALDALFLRPDPCSITGRDVPFDMITTYKASENALYPINQITKLEMHHYVETE